jgi:hypothetical protein
MLEKYLDRFSKLSLRGKQRSLATTAESDRLVEAKLLARLARTDASIPDDNPSMPEKLFEVPLQNLSESACIAAIDFFTEAVRTRLEEIVSTDHGYESDFLISVFVHPAAKISERIFFEHVSASCPGAAGPLRELITTYLEKTQEPGPFSKLFATKVPLRSVTRSVRWC